MTKRPPSIEFSQSSHNIKQKVAILNVILGQTDVELTTESIVEIEDLIRELDEVSGFLDTSVLFSGQGRFVTYEETQPTSDIPFEVDTKIGLSKGFEVWSDDETNRVYLMIEVEKLQYNDAGELESGSVYFLDLLHSTVVSESEYFATLEGSTPSLEISTVSAVFDEILDEIDNMAALYPRMIKSAKFKNADIDNQRSEINKKLTRLNNTLRSLRGNIGVVTPCAYTRDSGKKNTQHVAPHGTMEISGEIITFVSLHEIMPELCPSPRHDQLCLAVSPDQNTMHALDCNTTQVVLVPFTCGMEYSMAFSNPK